ncbi:hypothetical protein VCR3J2_320349 [Vibrio coralliirubri]|nr:hypothetical protein VCR3J2_320349 [Vibrio coralliirubri]
MIGSSWVFAAKAPCHLVGYLSSHLEEDAELNSLGIAGVMKGFEHTFFERVLRIDQIR